MSGNERRVLNCAEGGVVAIDAAWVREILPEHYPLAHEMPANGQALKILE